MASVSKREWTHNGATKEAWVVRYKDRDGAHRSKQFARKRPADEYRRKVENELEAGTHVARNASPTFADVATEFIAHQGDRQRRGEIGRGRMDCIIMSVRKYILPKLGTRRLSEVTAVDLEKWHRDIVQEFSLAPRTSRLRLNAISLMYQYAIARGFKGNNPVAGATALIGPRKRAVIRTLKLDEVNRLLQAVNGDVGDLLPRRLHYLRCAVYLALFCGLRAGEIRALTIEHVDLENRILTINHNLTPYLEFKGPKSAAGVRRVPMPPQVVDLLREQLASFTVANAKGYIFTTGSGKPRRPACLTNGGWNALREAAGLTGGDKSIHFHALRHFMVSYMLENRQPIARVSRMVGHANPKVTLGIYTHLISEDLTPEPMDEMAGDLLTAIPALPNCANDAQTSLSA